jgi:hypothetical protein
MKLTVSLFDPSRHIAVPQQFGRSRGEADIGFGGS